VQALDEMVGILDVVAHRLYLQLLDLDANTSTRART
jgi:hypothetical protein